MSGSVSPGKKNNSLRVWLWRARAELKLRILLLLRALGLLRWLNLQISIASGLGTKPLRVPLLAGAGMQNILMTERWMLDLMRVLFRQRSDGVFIDVGVNVGQTLIKLRRLRPEQAYLGFEPNPSCLHYLSELFRLNDLGDSRVLPVGLDLAAGLRELVYYDEEDSVSSSATLRGESFRPLNRVNGRRIVSLVPFEQIEHLWLEAPIGIVKIDVEGAEEFVLNTLEPMLTRSRAPVMIEILPEPSVAANTEKNSRIGTLLERMDYRIYRVVKQQDDFTGLALVSEIGANLDVDGWDYVLLPTEWALQ